MAFFIVGMMGSGKTTIGKKISKILNMKFIDMDSYIEALESKSIRDIFNEKGEIYFRTLETKTLNLLKDKEIIVSCGGGVILKKENREILKKYKTVFLDTDLQLIKNRMNSKEEIEKRPLLKKESIESIFEKRKNYYNKFKTFKYDIKTEDNYIISRIIRYFLDENKIISEDNSIQNYKIILNYKVEELEDTFIMSEKVNQIYGKKISKKIILENGEKSKSIENFQKIMNYLVEKSKNRSHTLVGFGGGTITDITGYSASVYKRGMKLKLIPTTLLSQVDAAIGGKNGIDYKGYKNIIGTFKYPEITIIDPLFILTLDESDYIQGLVEAFKINLLSGEGFEIFEKEYENILNRNINSVLKIINNSIKQKINIVKKDFEDKGIRNILNYGHTLGHAFESITGKPHGLSVAWGIRKENEILKKKGIMDDHTFYYIDRILIKIVGEELLNINIESKNLKDFIINDKKINRNKINLISIIKPGSYELLNIDLKDFLEMI
jgi:shikimate kinase/3-dehydroquinate synthase